MNTYLRNKSSIMMNSDLKNREEKVKDEKEELFKKIKSNVSLLEKLFLDKVLIQLKKKNVGNKNSSVEKLAMNELNKYKKDIQMLKSKVSVEDNSDKVIRMENKLKENEEILQKLNNEKEGLANIYRQQLKGLSEACLNETQIQIQTKHEEIRQIKDQTMQLKNIYNENENILKKKQEQLINLDNQLKKTIISIKNSKNNSAPTSLNTMNSKINISNFVLQNLKAQIDMINNNIDTDSKFYDEKIEELENNIKEEENNIDFLTSQMDEIKKNNERINLEIKKMRKQKREW